MTRQDSSMTFLFLILCFSLKAPAEIITMLLGRTGSGKSSAANVILGEKKFEAFSDPNSVTKDCQKEKINFKDKKITVIDTPGIFDPERPEGDLKHSIVSCITDCAPGPYVFILVLEVGRYTKEKEESVKTILKWFGKDVLKHTVVLFTHGDELEEKQTIEEFVEMNQDLKKFVHNCGNRVHVIDSKYWNKKDGELGQKNPDESEYRSNNVQIKQLLTTIENMVRNNGGSHYTNELLQVVEKAIVTEIKSEEDMEDRTEKADESDIKRARERVRTKILKILAGVAAGAILGALLGAGAGVSVAVVLAVEIGLGVAAGLSAAAGAIGGGMVGAKVAARVDTVGEAIKNTGVAVVAEAVNIAKEVIPKLAGGLPHKKIQ